MQKTLFAFAFLCLFACTALAQEKVNLSRPLNVNLSDKADSSVEELTIKLRKPEIEESPESLIVTNFRITRCSATDNNRKTVQGSLQDNSGSWQCVLLKGDDDNRKLSANWTTLTLDVTYVYTDSNGRENTRTFRFDPLGSCFRTSEIVANIGPETTRPAADKVVVNVSLNADMRVNISLKKGGTLYAKQEIDNYLLPASSKEIPITLKKVADPGISLTPGVYTLEITPNKPDASIKNGKKTDLWVRDFTPYQIKGLDTIKIIPDDAGNVKFTVGTTDNGTMELLLNGKSFETQPKGNAFTFNIPSNRLNDGANTVILKGVSSNDVELEGNPTFAFVKEKNTYLDPSTVAFSLDDKDVLTIKYKLTRKIRNRWQFVKSDNTPGLSEESTAVGTSGEYEAKIDLRTQNTDFIALINSQLKGNDVKTAPLVIQIASLDGTTPYGAFKMDFIKPDQKLIDGLKPIIEKIRKGEKSTPKSELKALLGSSTSDQTIQTIFDLIKEQSTGDANNTKTVIYKVLGIAGKLVAGYFGIPLPF